jgi:hypothetical protein
LIEQIKRGGRRQWLSSVTSEVVATYDPKMQLLTMHKQRQIIRDIPTVLAARDYLTVLVDRRVKE